MTLLIELICVKRVSKVSVSIIPLSEKTNLRLGSELNRAVFLHCVKKRTAPKQMLKKETNILLLFSIFSKSCLIGQKKHRKIAVVLKCKKCFLYSHSHISLIE